ncbi:MAG: VanZ family protein [Lachnospiraceae bacterium]|nr:VanZ family protein [Lachnospiraceae bacterium]
MKFLINFLLKPMSFIPAILVMLTIYSFSAQTSMESSKISSGLTVKIVKTADKILDIRMTTEQTNRVVERIHHFVRKLAHFSEYFLLAVCVALPLYVYGIRGIWLILTGSIFCFGFAAFDEMHQLFVNGRSGQIKDVILDSSGALTGIISVRILGYIFRKCIFEPILNRAKKI